MATFDAYTLIERGKRRSDLSGSADYQGPLLIEQGEWFDYLNSARNEYRDTLVLEYGENYFEQEYYFTLVPGTDRYPFPSTLQKFLGLDVQQSSGSGDWAHCDRFSIRERDRFMNLRPGANGHGGLAYMPLESNVWVMPQVSAPRTARLYYVPQPTRMTGSGDTVDLLPGGDDFIVTSIALMAADKARLPDRVSFLSKEKADQLGRLRAMVKERDAGEPTRVVYVGPNPAYGSSDGWDWW